MADLPDIDTTQVGFIAFWNAIDQGGVSSIDPSEVTSDASIVEHTVFDNGIEGTYTSLTGRVVDFRVKSDGWLVVWMDRTNDYAQDESVADNVRGYWDVLNDWTTWTTTQLDANTLERVINSLRGELSNSGAMSYASGDVGLFNFEFSSATTASVLSHQLDVTQDNITESPRFSYTADTTVLFAAATARVNTDASGSNADVEFEGLRLCAVGESDDEYGTADLLSLGLIPDAETEYGHDQSGSSSFSNRHARSGGNVLLLWN